MKTVRRIALLTLTIGGILFLMLWSYCHFSFYDAETYASMADLSIILQEELKPYDEEDFEKYHLSGIESYTYSYSYPDEIVTVKIVGEKCERVTVKFTKDLEEISYEAEKPYGVKFFIKVAYFIVATGFIPAIVVSCLITISKKSKEKGS